MDRVQVRVHALQVAGSRRPPGRRVRRPGCAYNRERSDHSVTMMNVRIPPSPCWNPVEPADPQQSVADDSDGVTAAVFTSPFSSSQALFRPPVTALPGGRARSSSNLPWKLVGSYAAAGWTATKSQHALSLTIWSQRARASLSRCASYQHFGPSSAAERSIFRFLLIWRLHVCHLPSETSVRVSDGDIKRAPLLGFVNTGPRCPPQAWCGQRYRCYTMPDGIGYTIAHAVHARPRHTNPDRARTSDRRRDSCCHRGISPPLRHN